MNDQQITIICVALMCCIIFAAFGCWGMFAANLNGGEYTGTLVAASVESKGSCTTNSKTGRRTCTYDYYRVEYFELTPVQTNTSSVDALNYITTPQNITPYFWGHILPNMHTCKVTRPYTYSIYAHAYYAAAKTKLHTKRTVWRYPYDYSQCYDQAIKDYNTTFGSICVSFAGICAIIIIFVACDIAIYDVYCYFKPTNNNKSAISPPPPPAQSIQLHAIYPNTQSMIV